MTSKSKDTELYATADFCLIPMGISDPSVGTYIARCQQILEKSGLEYKMQFVPYFSESFLRLIKLALSSGYGTNLEGPWSAVSQAIHDCHAAVHAMGAPRIATDIRIGTRTDKDVTTGKANDGKVRRVEEILEGWKKDGTEA